MFHQFLSWMLAATLGAPMGWSCFFAPFFAKQPTVAAGGEGAYGAEYREVRRTVYRCVPETKEQEIQETVVVPDWREEERQRTILVPVTREETRERVVVRTEWQAQQRERTVMVPEIR